jgi:protein TonB
MRVPKWAVVVVCGLGVMAMRAQTSQPATPESSSGTMSGSLSESAPPPVQRSLGPARISGGVMAGLILNKVPPQYPVEARNAGVSGTVVMHAIIDKGGMIKNLTVISGPALLQTAAVDAVKQWTYRPYLLNGMPTEVDTTILVNFDLSPKPRTIPEPN